ncbi:hypothetical protein B0I37DRAFT_382424 [Chaetomium sp. MPI-CAGE-AT-0009]|nr:hypothetical protein B0I37DRAFT_382424 [Chaetomium sp. MPI-CAGE-AT-0009]
MAGGARFFSLAAIAAAAAPMVRARLDEVHAGKDARQSRSAQQGSELFPLLLILPRRFEGEEVRRGRSPLLD